MTTEVEKERSADKVEFPPLQMNERKESDLPIFIKSLEEEELQIAELYDVEKSNLNEVTSHLKSIIASLNTPLRIDPVSFSEVVLSPQGKIFLVNNGTVITSVPLENLSAPVLIKVLVEVVPEIKRLLVKRKIQMGARADVLEKSAREFGKVSASFPTKHGNEESR